MKPVALTIALLALAATGGAAVARLPLEDAWGTLATVLLIAAGTFISEDLTCITTGLLIGRGELAPATGILGCFAGIYAGDLGLWLVGRHLWRWVARWKWVAARLPHDRMARLGERFDRGAPAAILASRFVPGSRLPLYLAAGALGRSSRTFMLWSLVAALVWTPTVVLAAAWVGEPFARAFEDLLGHGLWSLLPVAVVALLVMRGLMRMTTTIGRARLAATVSRLWRWEFWPAWLFYLPLVPWLLWLSIRHRGFMVVTAANPGMPHGGFVGESKSDILRRLPPAFVAPFACIESGDIEQRMAMLDAFLTRHNLALPVILKPDAGQRGVGVRLAREMDAARDYLLANPRAIIAQAFHPGPFEAGIFYARMPGAPRGFIFSITDKAFPVVTGDGASTLEELIWRHPRYRMQAGTFLTRHFQSRRRVLDAGERFTLGMAGNHCQGTMFLDGAHLITPQLEAAIDAIARQYDGFHFGRFDVRYADVNELSEGRGFSIIELNGATSESTNLYDPRNSVFTAWRVLMRQWSLLFQIGAANRALGHSPSSVSELLSEILGHYRGRRASLLAD